MFAWSNVGFNLTTGGEARNAQGLWVSGDFFPFDKSAVEVVGVAGDAKYTDLRTAVPPTLYVPALQQVGGEANFALRLDGAPAAVFPVLRAAVREIDPALPVLNLRTQDEQLNRLHGQELLFARLSGFFGVLALALACVGLYGLMSYAVVRRRGEIGLRMALGALPAHVLSMMLRESLSLVCVGVVAGLAAAGALSGLVKSMLFGLSPLDPITYAAVASMLIGVAVLASYLPARRASRPEPTQALREEQGGSFWTRRGASARAERRVQKDPAYTTRAKQVGYDTGHADARNGRGRDRGLVHA